MAVYSIGYGTQQPTPELLRAIRSHSRASIGQLKEALLQGESVATFDTDDYTTDDSAENQTAQVRVALVALSKITQGSWVRYSPSPDDDFEEVTLDEALNLLQSELDYLDQEHD